MRIGFLAAIALVFLLASARSLRAELTDAQVNDFLAKVDAAAATNLPLKAFALYETKGPTDDDLRKEIKQWSMQMEGARLQGMRPNPTSFLPLDSDALDPETVRAAREGKILHGQPCRMNLPVVGFAEVSFTNGQTTASMLLPVGQEPDGSLRFSVFAPTGENAAAQAPTSQAVPAK